MMVVEMMQSEHFVSGNAITAPFPAHMAKIRFGMGCFWGVERLFWQKVGIYVTSVGYGGGHFPNPDYKLVCSGSTNHIELVEVVYDPSMVSLNQLLTYFWESHDPTQGNRQGNDRGTQYRSAIFVDNDTDLKLALASRDNFQQDLTHAGKSKITTEIKIEAEYYLAEEYHQQYLAKNPNGYCGLAGTGVAMSCAS